jgi:hypothetical protein
MKKKLILIKALKEIAWLKVKVVIVFLLITIIGCKDDTPLPVPKPDPKPIPVKVEAHVYAMPSSVVKYNNPVTTVFWETKNVASATVNNTSIPVNDSIKFEYLTKDTTLNFTFIGKNGEKVEKSMLVDVGEPTKIDIMTDLLCLAPWQAVKRETEKSPGVWEDTGLSEKYMRNIRTFYKDGTYDIYDPLEKTYSIYRSGGKWNFINENTLFYGGKTDSIISLTDKELVLGFYFIVYNYEMKQDVNGPRGRTTYKRI